MKCRPRNKKLYKKALEIFTLSRNISTYLIHDMASLRETGEEDAYIYFTGDIIQQSDALALSILNAYIEIAYD